MARTKLVCQVLTPVAAYAKNAHTNLVLAALERRGKKHPIIGELYIPTRSGHQEPVVVFVRHRPVEATLKIKNLGFLEILTAVISIFGSLKILLNLNIQTSEVMISTHYIYIYCNLSVIISLIFIELSIYQVYFVLFV